MTANSIEHFAQVPIGPDHGEGVYRVFPLAWTVETATKEDSKSVAIAFRFGVAQQWDATDRRWSAEWPPGYFVEHRAWVVKKDGELNTGAIESLAKCGLWDGDWDKLSGACPVGFFLLADVKAETYEGKTRYRAAWINPNADEPQARGGFAPVDTNLLGSLRARFQSKTRAVAGGARSGGPGAPPPQPTAAQPQPIAQPQPQFAAPVNVAPPQSRPVTNPQPRPAQFAPQHAAPRVSPQPLASPQPLSPPVQPAPQASPYSEAFGDPTPDDIGPVPFG